MNNLIFNFLKLNKTESSRKTVNKIEPIKLKPLDAPYNSSTATKSTKNKVDKFIF